METGLCAAGSMGMGMGMGMGGVGLCNNDMRGMRAGYFVYFVLDWTILFVVKVLRPWRGGLKRR